MTWIRRNATIASTRLDGTPVYRQRRVSLDDMETTQDVGLVEIMADSSSALAPLLQLLLIDDTSARYQRGDIVTILRGDGFRAPPNSNPYHVLRVKQNYAPLADTEVWLARLDVLTQTAQWLQRITPDMPDVTYTLAWDPARSQIVATTDGTFGVGLQRTINGVTYGGYLPAVPVQLGVNEYAESTSLQDIGIVDAEHPVILYESPLQFTRNDVLVLTDGRRLVVSDLQHRLQRMAVVLATLQLTEWRTTSDVCYQVPLTGAVL